MRKSVTRTGVVTNIVVADQRRPTELMVNAGGEV